MGVKRGGVPGVSTGSVAICAQAEGTAKPRSKPEGVLLVGRWGEEGLGGSLS